MAGAAGESHTVSLIQCSVGLVSSVRVTGVFLFQIAMSLLSQEAARSAITRTHARESAHVCPHVTMMSSLLVVRVGGQDSDLV